MQNLSFLRGDCLARLGRDAEAETAFLQELRDYPSNPSPRTALAMLYASQGREADARRSLTQLVEDLRTPEAYFAAARTYEVLGDVRSAAGAPGRGAEGVSEARASGRRLRRGVAGGSRRR